METQNEEKNHKPAWGIKGRQETRKWTEYQGRIVTSGGRKERGQHPEVAGVTPETLKKVRKPSDLDEPQRIGKREIGEGRNRILIAAAKLCGGSREGKGGGQG